MSETVDTEEITDKAGVKDFLDIHLQDAKKVVITKVTGQNFQYLAEATFDNPVIDNAGDA